LGEGPPAQRGDAPGEDPVEAIWHRLLRGHLQPGAFDDGRDDEGNAAQILEEHARNRLDSGMIAGARERERAMIESARVVRTRPPARPAC
jgi:DNA polymerase